MQTTTTPDNTNTIYLTDPTYSTLSPFLSSSADVFKCPADKFLAAGLVRRGFRSYSMNGAMGIGADVGAGGLPGTPKNEPYG